MSHQTPYCVDLELVAVRCLVLGLDELIELKRAAGRPTDLEALAERVAIREGRGDGASWREPARGRSVPLTLSRCRGHSPLQPSPPENLL